MSVSVFAERLRNAMNSRGLKQVDLVHAAEHRGVKMGKSHISQYVAGKTMPREDVLLLYGSSVYEEVLAFNATLHADYALCSRLIRVNPALRKAFKNAFSYSHFIVCVLGRYDV